MRILGLELVDFRPEAAELTLDLEVSKGTYIRQVAVDLVYHPRVTPWLARAASSGASPVGGVEVLVHQAALAISLWLGESVPLGVLHDAAVAP